ncbi:MAG: adenylate/guanylate cyclase domain-containing protein [Microcoleus sp. PH2017_29_MFU_D_A]|uniref:adenylate/guanylate cyclase domain-containing protein n=1 Tax=unclassified Microcoleus TaxID=2642155 RepID=UPI001D35A4A5|nr:MULTISPECIES: adenylate/guanylate cyclase domain-containing protein [unclassified Microcoleus]MCC3584025.1 adenylate/guanylate cyclase domain-containing protein [Microcoleus sp. PH2017_30_WIL_O_A]MCC3601928.1 adenylate/guanylate cyclase domain-containing protein [Microcoleus sp. PH2017_29_MFU_D_A]MCC3633155.1 adenylate/guanylate cyclase domain-containing protein [Microcoleus sp. PH2017_37_MFU_D_B]
MQLVNHLSIKTKLIVMLLVVSLCAMLASTFICSSSGKAILTEKVFNQLTSLRAVKAYQIQDYFENLKNHTQTLSEDLTVVAALQEFKTAYSELEKFKIPANFDAKIDTYYQKEFLTKLTRTNDGSPVLAAYRPKTPAARYLQYHYIAANPNPVGKKLLLDTPGDASAYSRAHALYHPIFRNIVEKYGYYDMFLIDREGTVVYTVFKEADFTTSLIDGPYKESNLANAIAAARQAKGKGYVKIVDFKPYSPSYGAPAAFIAAPIFNGSEFIGILAFQFPVDKINNVMTGNKNWKQSGLGDSGETYLVGSDYLMRSASRFQIEDPEGHAKILASIGTDEKTIKKIKEFNTTILLQQAQTTGVKEALFGKQGTQVIDDYRHIPVLSSYSPLDIDGLRWVILAEMDVSEAYASIHSFQKTIVMAATAIIAIITVVAMWLTAIFVRPIKKLIASARLVGAGEVDAVVKSGSEDEFGELAKSFNQTIGRLRAETQLIQQKNRENEALVLNIFSPAIAKRLKQGDRAIADQISHVSVLFSDLHRFTKLSQTMSAPEVIALLDELVTAFDEMTEKYGLEKIKTIGDGYMAVCGLSVPRLDHDKRTVDFALEMLAFVHRFNYEKGLDLDVEIGINSGDVVAGVIGKNKLLYDVWGESVNIANRLKSACPPGAIFVSQDIYDRLHDLYDFELVGEIQESGKEKLVAWQITSYKLPVNVGSEEVHE